MHFTCKIFAYDSLETVQWSVTIVDHDGWGDEITDGLPWTITGALQGRGAESQPRWLREVLEDIREHM